MIGDLLAYNYQIQPDRYLVVHVTFVVHRVSSCVLLQQASQVYRELHPGLRIPILRQHSHNNKCDVTTDDEI